MRPGDTVWAYTTSPERANPHQPPVRVELVDSMQWDGRTLWRCREVDSPYGSQWHWDEACLTAERVETREGPSERR